MAVNATVFTASTAVKAKIIGHNKFVKDVMVIVLMLLHSQFTVKLVQTKKLRLTWPHN
jgi:hypothetical protein